MVRREIQLWYDEESKTFAAETHSVNGVVSANGNTPDQALAALGGTLLGLTTYEAQDAAEADRDAQAAHDELAG